MISKTDPKFKDTIFIVNCNEKAYCMLDLFKT